MRVASGPRTLGLASIVLLLCAAPAAAVQDAQTEGQEPRMVNQSDDPLLRGYRWRSIGPAGQGGRVDDIAVVENDPATWYIGFSTAGIWKTVNHGITFEPIFDTFGSHSVGDLAVAPSNPDILYVGTGEPNNRQSSSFGDGMYRSSDAGRTFTHIGLRETESIGRVVVHPTNPDIVWVAAVGRLFGPNPERGVYKSTDGGATWRNVLFINDDTGATEIVIHPTNPDILFAATYERRRSAWGFASGGPSTGIWRSGDGGETWSRVSGGGLPEGTMGRIGLDIARSNPDVIYAQIEVGPDREPVAEQPPPQQGQGGGFGGNQNLPPDDRISGIWRSQDGGRTWEFRSNENQRPMYYSQIRVDPSDENKVWVGGVRAMKSTDGGATWTNVQGGMGHVDNHAIWINPADGRNVIYGNDGSIDVTWDDGANWESLRTWAVGQPYHASVDMRRPYFVCTGFQDNGTWCGPSSVRGGPILNHDWYRVGGGDGFYTAIDPTDWTVLYAESQNGNVSRVDLRDGASRSIRPRGQAGGGGGGGPFGGAPSNIVPTPERGTQIRFNWNTPFQLSPHNPRTLILGGNRLFISRDRGDTWTMSGDLTRQIDRDQREILGMRGDLPNCSRLRMGRCILSKNDGVSAFGTIVSVAESPLVPGIYWVGTDDGNIQVSRDGGATFTEVSGNLPGGGTEYYVSRVEPSRFDPATAYVSIDGHRSGDMRPYVYVTRDYGATFTDIGTSLPAFGNVNTVRQDPRNPRLLYAGTEFGFFVSIDEGATWKPFMTNLPVVRIDDVLVHPRDNDLVLATHGRSIWILDDVTALQQLTDSVRATDMTLLEPREAILWKSDIRMRRNVTGAKNAEGENAERGTAISYWLGRDSDDVTLTITDVTTGELFRTLEPGSEEGLNRVHWDLCSDRRPVQPGQGFGGFGGGGCGGGGGGGQQGPPRVARLAEPGLYRVTLTVGDDSQSHLVRVLEDVWMNDR